MLLVNVLLERVVGLLLFAIVYANDTEFRGIEALYYHKNRLAIPNAGSLVRGIPGFRNKLVLVVLLGTILC